jgi:hypothetical protein
LAIDMEKYGRRILNRRISDIKKRTRQRNILFGVDEIFYWSPKKKETRLQNYVVYTYQARSVEDIINETLRVRLNSICNNKRTLNSLSRQSKVKIIHAYGTNKQCLMTSGFIIITQYNMN